MSAPLTPAGEAAVAELAQRYRVSDGAVRTLLAAVVRGGGAMAQFSHPELGGSGQWMRGGMTMVGDMFNPGLQSTVAGICSDLASRLGSGELLARAPGNPDSAAVGSFGGDWWPSDLGRPSSTGGQNDSAYAYFPGARRLAIKRGAVVNLYDTGDHAISGVQQQQGGRGSLEFSSQFGSFTVDQLPLVGGDAGLPGSQPARNAPTAGRQSPPAAPQGPAAAQQAVGSPPATPSEQSPVQPPPAQPEHAQAVSPPVGAASPTAPPPAPPVPLAADRMSANDIGAAIETLAGLRDKGFVTEDEFTAKKVELLGRL